MKTNRTSLWKSFVWLIVLCALAIGAFFGSNVLIARSLDLHSLVQIGDVEAVEWVLCYASGRANEVASISSVGYEISSAGKRIALNREHLTPLGISIRCRQNTCMELLIEHGADISISSGKYGHTPLIWSLVENNEYALKTLCEAGADVNVANGSGMTPIYFVSDVSEAELLVRHGARLDVTDVSGDTPLIHHLGRTHILEYLIDAGADLNAITPDDETALDVAELYGYPIAAEILRKHGARTAPELDAEEKPK